MDKTCFIEALPYPLQFAPARTAVIMIDMQRDFILPGGFGDTLGNDVAHLLPAVGAAHQLLDWCRAQNMLVVHTKEAHAADLSDCPLAKRHRGAPKLRIGDQGAMGRILINGEFGTDFVEELTPLPGEIVITKPGKGAFYATELGQILKNHGITHLLFGGVTTEVCVQTTMREANDRGYECVLIEEATESYFPHFKQATLEMIRAQEGIVGWTASLKSILTATPQHHEESKNGS
ncbi:MAG: cysteine hydrolase [Halothiobacillus sp. 20-54-6]|nr:MAG: cysteine hydrolase [Halothiobacillus sp. 20-54-6]